MNEVEPGQPVAAPAPERVGDRLRAAREGQGLSLAEIGQRTRVPLRHLEAIEASDFGALPSPTYAIGFARAYARAVGLDEVSTARDVRGELSKVERAPEYVPYEAADPERVPSRGVAIVGLGLAIALLVLVGLYYGTGLFRSGGAPVTTAAVPAATPSPDVAAAPAPVPTPAAPRQVVLAAGATEVWLRVYDAANTTLYLGTLAPGASFAVPPTADRPMINVGRPDELRVTVDGQAVPPLGDGRRPIRDVPVDAVSIAARLTGAPVAPPAAAATPVAATRARAEPSSPPRRRVLTETQRANLAAARNPPPPPTATARPSRGRAEESHAYPSFHRCHAEPRPVGTGAGPVNLEPRVGRLESEMRAVQRRVFPGGGGQLLQPDVSAPAATVEAPGAPASSAVIDLSARVSSLEGQMATLTGQIEQTGYQLRTLREQFETYKRTTDARLASAATPSPVAGALTEDDVPAARPAPARPAATRPARGAAPSTLEDSAEEAGVAPPRTTTRTPAATRTPAPAGATAAGATAAAATTAIARPATGDPAEDSYLYGFRLWEAKRYTEAQAALKRTVADFPRSRRASYAQNLLGRAYLDDGKPSLASMAFYDNYKKMPDGERAPDSLLYLGQALQKLNKPADACKVYDELSDVYAGKLSTQMQADVTRGRAAARCK